MSEMITTHSSITLLMLKELRLERNVHQAQLADACGKTPSAWTKIETGTSPLTMEVLFQVCNRLAVLASTVLAASERYATYLASNNWVVMSKQISFDEDTLLKFAQEYYLSPGFRSRNQYAISLGHQLVPVLNSPMHLNGRLTPINVIDYATNLVFRNSQNQVVSPTSPTSPTSPPPHITNL